MKLSAIRGIADLWNWGSRVLRTCGIGIADLWSLARPGYCGLVELGVRGIADLWNLVLETYCGLVELLLRTCGEAPFTCCGLVEFPALTYCGLVELLLRTCGVQTEITVLADIRVRPLMMTSIF